MNRPEPVDSASRQDRYFGPQGVLKARLPQFAVRREQAALAEAVCKALEGRYTLVAEAGTGVGKTFAYLIPLLTSGRKAIVSTASRTLQDQLFQRDVPRLLQILGLSARVVRLKGRANYLCPYRLETAQADARFNRAEDWQVLREVRRFAATTEEGDLADCSGLPEDSPVIPWVTSTGENCLGNSCPKISDCFVVKARNAAWQADLVIVNHHLFCADLALRRGVEQSILPDVDTILIDEAHGFIATASQAFSDSVSSHQAVVLARDMLATGLRLVPDGAPWAELSSRLEQSTMAFRAEFAGLSPGKWDWMRLATDMGDRLHSAIRLFAEGIAPVRDALQINRERHPEIDRLANRAQTLLETLSVFQDPQSGPAINGMADRVFWLERTKFGVSLQVAPLDLAEPLAEVFQAPDRSWVFLSATLAADQADSQEPEKAFGYFTRRLGLQPGACLLLGSPFDYQKQALLVLPQALPDPKTPDLITQLLAMPGVDLLFEAIPGGILILCTSLRAVALAATHIRSRPGQFLANRRLLVQGEAARGALLEAFRGHGRGLLIGSASFWEGVDVPGLALSMVMIDKLPFAPPDDPVMQARMQQARQRGQDPFRAIQCPEALLVLKQGIGRLIRSETDKGVLMVGDRRLHQTGYGRSMLAGLPNFSTVTSMPEAIAQAQQLFEGTMPTT
jgi:ATP-dependent DNA helicase DinG